MVRIACSTARACPNAILRQSGCKRSQQPTSKRCSLPVAHAEPQEAAPAAPAEGSSNGTSQIPGLQKFISGIWDRKRHVPNNLYKDPLVTLFEDFDLNKDGRLTVDEITSALNSEGVQITNEQVQEFVASVDQNENAVIDQHEFSGLIFKMAGIDKK